MKIQQHSNLSIIDKLRKVRVMYLKATKRVNKVVARLPGGTCFLSS